MNECMVNLIKEFEASQLSTLKEGRNFPAFRVGDTVKVYVKISDESESERTQAYEGLCIAKSKGGLNANFTVRKISYGEGVERTFQLYSPRLVSIEVIKKGKVRRAKLYYMRGLRGKAARLETLVDKNSKTEVAVNDLPASSSSMEADTPSQA